MNTRSRFPILPCVFISCTATPLAPHHPLVGPDQTIPLSGTAHFDLTLPADKPRVFWSKISGPGVAQFDNEQFNSSFEDGTVNAWLADNGGDVTGGGSVTTERAHSGLSSWKAYNDSSLPDPFNFSAKLERWRFDDDSAYYSAWYWWPADYLVNGQGHGPTRDYLNIFQYKARTAPWDPVWIVAVIGVPGSTDKDEFELHAWDYLEAPTGVLVPKGRWFQLTTFLREGRGDGQITVWLDGVVIANHDGVNTLGDTTNISPPHVMWGVGNYSTVGIGKSLYIDDAVVVPAGLPVSRSARFSAPGVYVLRLTASNDVSAESDSVTVTVQ